MVKHLASLLTYLLFATGAWAQVPQEGTGVPNAIYGIVVGSPVFGGVAGQCFYNNSGVIGTQACGGTSVTSANPSATIGLTAVNGTAGTFMTSDSAPPLSQAIAPTWTGLHTFSPAANTNGLRVSGGSITGSSTVSPGISITGTLNTSGSVIGAGLLVNLTNTASGNATTLADFQTGGTSRFSIRYDGFIDNSASPAHLGNMGLSYSGAGLFDLFSNNGRISMGTTPDTFFTRPTAATWQLGAANAASPVAQTLQVQGSRAATDTNVGGANLTVTSGNGTGTGTPSSLIFQTPVVVGSGTGAQTQTTGLTVKNGTFISTGYTVASLPTVHVAGARAHVTDQLTTCAAIGVAPTGGGALTCPVFDNGTAWVGG